MSRRIRFRRLVRQIAFLVLMVVMVPLIDAAIPSTVSAASDHAVTFINDSGETLWLGSGVNADGSLAIANLPMLAAGQSATVSIPDAGSPNHWRGRFFARQRCTGQSGSTFHCQVGDCGIYADHCTAGAQPVSLAEFNFDRNDNNAPWYDVSYVDAMSLPVTIAAQGADQRSGAGSCGAGDCSHNELLAACPAEDVRTDQQTGARLECVNPNRDGQSSYTANLNALAPRAYLWSSEDRVSGNSLVYSCGQCGQMVVTFQGRSSSTTARAPAAQAVALVPGGHSFRGYAGKCIDVPGGISADGAQLQLWDCNGTAAQRFTSGPGGTEMVLDKCLDVAWASRDNGAKVQIAWCNGGPAQVWTRDGGGLRNPNSGKCVDVKDWNSADGAPLQMWDCSGNANQAWTPVAG